MQGLGWEFKKSPESINIDTSGDFIGNPEIIS
jgi:hypothetical protein